MELGDDDNYCLEVDITKMTAIAINYWLQQFVVETRKGNREHSPDSLHQICCGLQWALRAAGNADINSSICLMAKNLHPSVPTNAADYLLYREDVSKTN